MLTEKKSNANIKTRKSHKWDFERVKKVVNIDKLKGKMREKNITQAELADSIGVARSTINRKINNGGDDFSIEEVQLIKL